MLAALGITAAGAGLVVAGPAERGGIKFKPQSLDGKWTGMWKNKTFNSQGAIRANVNGTKRKMTTVFDIDGFVFGCGDPQQEKSVEKKGSGKNRFSRSGFKSVDNYNVLGKTVFVYKEQRTSTDKVNGSTINKTDCGGTDTKFKGTVKGNKNMKLKVDILDNSGTKFAEAVVTANKK